MRFRTSLDPDCESRHNLRYWQRRPYLGLGLDASSMLRESAKSANHARSGYVLRFTNTDELKAYLDGPQPRETAWLSPERQHEEAWFLGLRLNDGVSVSALRQEFGNQMVAHALEVVEALPNAACSHSTVKLRSSLPRAACSPTMSSRNSSRPLRRIPTLPNDDAPIHSASYHRSDSSCRTGIRNLPGSNSSSASRQ